MDNLTEVEKEFEKGLQPEPQVEVETAQEKNESVQEQKTEVYANEGYLKSFENKTVADFIKENEEALQSEADTPRKQLVENEVKEEKEFLAEQHAYAMEVFERERQEKNSQQPEQQKFEQEILPEEETKKSEENFQNTEEKNKNIIEKPNYDLIEENKKIVKLKKKTYKKKQKSSKIASVALACALAVSGIVCVTNCVLIEQYEANYIEVEDIYNLNLYKYLKNIYNLDATKSSMEVIETYPEEVLSAGDLGEKSNWFDRICEFISGLFGG